MTSPSPCAPTRWPPAAPSPTGSSNGGGPSCSRSTHRDCSSRPAGQPARGPGDGQAPLRACRRRDRRRRQLRAPHADQDRDWPARNARPTPTSPRTAPRHPRHLDRRHHRPGPGASRQLPRWRPRHDHRERASGPTSPPDQPPDRRDRRRELDLGPTPVVSERSDLLHLRALTVAVPGCASQARSCLQRRLKGRAGTAPSARGCRRGRRRSSM